MLSGRASYDYLISEMPEEAKWLSSIREYDGHYYGKLGGKEVNRQIPIDQVQAYVRSPHTAGPCNFYNPLQAPRYDSVMDFVDTLAAACSNEHSSFRLADMSIKFRLSIAQSLHHLEPADFIAIKNAALPPKWITMNDDAETLEAMYHSTMASNSVSIAQHGPGRSLGAGCAQLERCHGLPVPGFYCSPELQKVLNTYPTLWIKIDGEMHPTWELLIWDGTLPLRLVLRGLVRPSFHLWKRTDGDKGKQYMFQSDHFYITHMIFIAGRPEHVHRSISCLLPVWGRGLNNHRYIKELLEAMTSGIPAEVGHCYNVTPGKHARKLAGKRRTGSDLGGFLAEVLGGESPECESTPPEIVCMTYAELQPDDEFTTHDWFARKRMPQDRRLIRGTLVYLGRIDYDEVSKMNSSLFHRDNQTWYTSMLDARPDLMDEHTWIPEKYSPEVSKATTGGVKNVLHIFTLAKEGQDNRAAAFAAACDDIMVFGGTVRDRVEAQMTGNPFEAGQQLLQSHTQAAPAIPQTERAKSSEWTAHRGATSKACAKPEPSEGGLKPAQMKRRRKKMEREFQGEDTRVSRECENYTKRFQEVALAARVFPQMLHWHTPRITKFPTGGKRISVDDLYPFAKLETSNVDRDPQAIADTSVWVKESIMDRVQVQLTEQRLARFRPIAELLQEREHSDESHDRSGLRLGDPRPKPLPIEDDSTGGSGSILAEAPAESVAQESETLPTKRADAQFVRAGMVAQTIVPKTVSLPAAKAFTGVKGTCVPDAPGIDEVHAA